MDKNRIAEEKRATKETDISLSLNIDGRGNYQVETGIGFFNHMLEGFARHGFFDLEVKAKGDVEVDSHHTIEDTGIVLGTAIKNALGDKKGIRRYGHAYVPLDESLCLWMRLWFFVPWIFPDVLIFLLRGLLPQTP